MYRSFFTTPLNLGNQKKPNYYTIFHYQEIIKKTFDWVITNFNDLVFIKER